MELAEDVMSAARGLVEYRAGKLANKTATTATYNMDKSPISVKKGDLIAIVGEHIMVYVGDGKIAHASSSAITTNNLGLEVVEEIKSYFKEKVYDTIIPRLVRLSEAPSHGKPIHAYDPRSRGTEAYINLAKEVIERNGN